MDDSGAILCQISSLKDMLDQVNEEIEESFQITREIESEIVKCSEIDSALAAKESKLMKTAYLLHFEINGLMLVCGNDKNTRTDTLLDVRLTVCFMCSSFASLCMIQRNASSTYFMFDSSDSRTSVKCLDEELSCLRVKQDEILKGMNIKRVQEVMHCYLKEALPLKDDERSASPSSILEVFTKSCLEFQKDIDEGENCELGTLLSEKEYLENEIHLLSKKNNSLQNSVSAFVEEILEELNSFNSALHVEIQCRNLENDKVLKDINELKSTLVSTLSMGS
ncbi:hypothetical protein RJ639_003421 [Escallonia herrerae]|uniref:Uncharacterized protein n=1 Tax=Escallonia herrerae TaxID=1293975 RepID=A0AA89B057_9ASTE|nr:hypothetical protein RJ639_003421 [Escallonia herrerae]